MPKTKKRELPAVGSVFQKRYRGKTYTLKVVDSPTGVGFAHAGHLFKTPTAAAKSIVKSAVNGWVFWKMDKE